jgi:hypothetical protein
MRQAAPDSRAEAEGLRVSSIPRVLRRMSSTPSSLSSWRNAFEIAGCVK